MLTQKTSLCLCSYHHLKCKCLVQNCYIIVVQFQYLEYMLAHIRYFVWVYQCNNNGPSMNRTSYLFVSGNRTPYIFLGTMWNLIYIYLSPCLRHRCLKIGMFLCYSLPHKIITILIQVNVA